MKILFYNFILFFLLLLSACRPSDFKINSPTAKKTGSSKVNFDHTLFTKVSCIQCHENKRPITNPPHGEGKDCLSCHSADLNAQGLRTWANITHFSHNPMPSSCLSCHESNRPLTLPPHTLGGWGNKADCVSCHTHPNWKPAKFDHNKPLTTCLDCHRTTTKDDRPIPKENHPSPQYNQLDCNQCHSNSNNSKRWTDYTFNHRTHSPSPSSCMNCHESKRPLSHTVLPKIAGMDKADCKSCHTSTTDWLQSVSFNHETAAPTSCMGCHQTSVPTNQATHPSLVGNYFKIDCIKCHTYDKTTSPRAWNKITFNQQTHAPAPSKCIECHKTVNNSLPSNGSHNLGSRMNLECASCHIFDSAKLWNNLSKFNHNLIDATERCDGCHSSTLPKMTSKPVSHISTSLDCKSCHANSAWKPATFTHTLSDTNCMSCHNGTTATGKSSNHVLTTNQCSSCHNQDGFKPVIAKTHSVENISTCTNCHNGNSTATAKTSGHLTTTLNCSSCHSNSAWKPATYAHASGETNCLNCHNGTIATGKPASHTLSGAQCSTCHSQTNWLKKFNTTYIHTNSIITKGVSRNHPSVTSCTKCHSTTTDSVNWVYTTTSTNTSINPKGTCAGCHLDSYNNKHGKLTGSLTKEGQSSTKAGNCMSCHKHDDYQNWN